MNDKSIDPLTLARFQKALKTAFRVLAKEAAWVELRLDEVVRRDPSSGGEVNESFSLLFQGPREPFLPQRIYSFQHEEMGAFDLFIVPISEEREGFRYEAVFNRRDSSP
jgi:hypothetical protein